MMEKTDRSQPHKSLQVNVGLLDTLMNLAGELVLSRNQLLQGINSANQKAAGLSSQRIDMITSELQETIMRTRMQPLDTILNKLKQVVRDYSRQLGKSIELTLEGQDVELDKTILEAINDPLTHLVRNAVDQGMESPEERKKTGKNAAGSIRIKAFHDAGQVNIIISDDGNGQNNDVNQGTGMDVVTTNIEGLGGVIELKSTPGKGTNIQIKLPLTLAIIPSQITSVGRERYAIPQVNLCELLRIPADQKKEMIERVGDAEVVRLRGELLPLLNLAAMLGIKRTWIDPESRELLTDKRDNIADRRRVLHGAGSCALGQNVNQDRTHRQRHPEDRRKNPERAVNIAVVSAGAYKYGLVVDALHDSEEIVVKPVGRHLKNCRAYAGATIMGDGKVALILDIANFAQMAELSAVSKTVQNMSIKQIHKGAAMDKVALLSFKNSESEFFATPLSLVRRIERIQRADIETISNHKIVQYRGGTLPLYELSQVGNFNQMTAHEYQEVIVFKVKDREVGLMVTPPLDAVDVISTIDEGTLKRPAISGSVVIKGRTTLLIDMVEMMNILNPDWFTE